MSQYYDIKNIKNFENEWINIILTNRGKKVNNMLDHYDFKEFYFRLGYASALAEKFHYVHQTYPEGSQVTINEHLEVLYRTKNLAYHHLALIREICEYLDERCSHKQLVADILDQAKKIMNENYGYVYTDTDSVKYPE